MGACERPGYSGSVIKAGGWKKLFPDGVLNWLHKLRNFFNVEPKYLRLVDKVPTDFAMHEVRKYGQMDSFVGKRALTGHVYFDEEIETWYQMSAGATIYDWGDNVRFESLEAAYTQKVYGQRGILVFKLVCPDGTGGSKETIISNPVLQKVKVVGPQGLEWNTQRGSKIGETNQQVSVENRVETRMKYQGSYNFSETTVVGLNVHKKRDVEPHHHDPVYIDPPDRFAPLNERIFNEFEIVAAGGTVPKKRSA